MTDETHTEPKASTPFEDTTFEDMTNDINTPNGNTVIKNGNAPRGYLPVALLSLAFMGFLGFQTWTLVSDQNTLTDVHIQQGKTLDQIEKVKAQLGALAKGTITLAEQGNKSAQEVLEHLRKAGINIQDTPQTAPLSVPSQTAPAQPGQPLLPGATNPEPRNP